MQSAISSLTFCYGPMTSHELANASNRIKAMLEPTSLYIIAKRRRPLMEIQSQDEKSIQILYTLESSKLEISLLLNQALQKELQYNNGIITVDRLIHLQHHGILKIISGKGSLSKFVTYEVLYVGQCVKEHIADRFKAHHALLSIFNNETILSSTYDKSEEILILPFVVNSNELTSVTADSSPDEMDKIVNAMLGYCIAPEEAFSYDCEKALIRAMDPKYNKTKFKSYPKSLDGLYPYEFDSICYAIDENIILSYGNSNLILGGNFGESVILIKENKDFEIILKTR